MLPSSARRNCQGRHDQITPDQPAPVEGGVPLSLQDKPWHQQSRRERAARFDRDGSILKPEPLTCNGKPRLVNRLLGAEQDPVPANPWLICCQLAQRRPLGLAGDNRQDTVGEFVMHFRVDANRSDFVSASNRAGAITLTVRYTANNACWPSGGSGRFAKDRLGRQSGALKRVARTHPGGREVAPALRRSSLNRCRLGWKQLTIVIPVVEYFGDHDVRRQYRGEHQPRRRTGMILTYSPGSPGGLCGTPAVRSMPPDGGPIL